MCTNALKCLSSSLKLIFIFYLIIQYLLYIWHDEMLMFQCVSGGGGHAFVQSMLAHPAISCSILRILISKQVMTASYFVCLSPNYVVMRNIDMHMWGRIIQNVFAATPCEPTKIL